MPAELAAEADQAENTLARGGGDSTALPARFPQRHVADTAPARTPPIAAAHATAAHVVGFPKGDGATVPEDDAPTLADVDAVGADTASERAPDAVPTVSLPAGSVAPGPSPLTASVSNAPATLPNPSPQDDRPAADANSPGTRPAASSVAQTISAVRGPTVAGDAAGASAASVAAPTHNAARTLPVTDPPNGSALAFGTPAAPHSLAGELPPAVPAQAPGEVAHASGAAASAQPTSSDIDLPLLRGQTDAAQRFSGSPEPPPTVTATARATGAEPGRRSAGDLNRPSATPTLASASRSETIGPGDSAEIAAREAPARQRDGTFHEPTAARLLSATVQQFARQLGMQRFQPRPAAEPLAAEPLTAELPHEASRAGQFAGPLAPGIDAARSENSGGGPPRFAADPAVVAEQLRENIIERAQLHSGVEETSFEIDIDPPELGKIRVRLVDTSHGLAAKLEVAQAETLKLLEQRLPHLRETLQDAGVQLAEADLSQHPGNSPSQGRPDDASQDFGANRQFRHLDRGRPVEGESREHEPLPRIPSHEGSIDVLA